MTTRSRLRSRRRERMRPLLLMASALLILAAAAISCAGADRVDQPYRIGVMDSLTGAGATYGSTLWQAKQMAAAEINAAGGVNGRMLELVEADSMCNADGARSAYRQLTADEGIKVILGTSCSGSMLTASALAEPDGVVMLSASATHPDIAQAGDYIFRTAFSSRQIGIATGNTMWADGARTLATITENTDYATGLRDVAIARFEELGGSLAASEQFETGTTDFRPVLEPLLATNPDALHIAPQAEASGGQIIKAARELGYAGLIYAEVVAMGRESLQIAGEAAVGVKGVMVALGPDNAKAQEVVTNFRQRYNYSPLPWFVGSGYDDVYLIAECLKQTGDDQDAAGIRDCLYGITWSGAISDSYRFDDDGEIVGLTASVVEPLPLAERTPENHGFRITGPAPAAP